MKLVSFRVEKDIEDIDGIINSMEGCLTGEIINRAMIKLYDGWDKVSDEAIKYISSRFDGLEIEKTEKVL